MSASRPRIALFLFGCDDRAHLTRILERIPESAVDRLEEIVVMQGARPAIGPGLGELPASERKVDLKIHRQPGDADHGRARKNAFEYALASGMDFAVAMRCDVDHPPEALPALLDPVLRDEAAVVIGSRSVRPRGVRSAGASLALPLGRRLLNHALGLRVRDPHSSLRVYATDLLRAVPFQLDDDDRLLEAQLLIQCRALGVAIHEVELPGVWWDEAGLAGELRHGLRSGAAAAGYRLHQLHVIRRGRYFVDHGIHYTLKQSPTSSHMQIVESIRSGSRVLDLGCSQGLLARPLRDKEVRVTGVDAQPEGVHTASELEGYYQRDLERPLELPVGRDFDYVVVADVIEHVRERRQLLRSARRFLKPEGRLLISTPNIALWFYRLSLLVGRFEYGPRGVLDRTHVHLYTRDSFRREVEAAGFRVVGERATSLPFEVVFESTGRSRLVLALARGYHWLARLWPELFAYQVILEAEITTLDEEAALPG